MRRRKEPPFFSRQQVIGILLAIHLMSPGAAVAAAIGDGVAEVTALRVVAEMPGLVDVRDFGAKGDGTADDTTAIQAAIRALPVQASKQAFGGGTVVLPAGTYRISANLALPDNVHLVGVGNTASQIQWVGGPGAALTLGLRCSIRDLWVRGNPAAPPLHSMGIDNRPSSGAVVTAHWVLLRVRVAGFDVGVELDRTWSAAIEDSIITNNTTAGVRFGSKDTNAIVVRGGELQGNRGAGAIVGRASSVVFDGVVIEQNGRGIEVNGGVVGLVVRDSYFEVNERGHLVHVGGGVPSMVQVVGNFFANASSRKAQHSLHAVGGVDWLIDGNAFLEANASSVLRFEKGVDRVYLGSNHFLPGRAFRASSDFLGTNLTERHTWAGNQVTPPFASDGGSQQSRTSNAVCSPVGTRRELEDLAEVLVDAARAAEHVVTVRRGDAFAIRPPLNPSLGCRMTIRVRNASGGELGAVRWASIYKLAPWDSPASGHNRAIDFQYDGAYWVEVSRTPQDVPN